MKQNSLNIIVVLLLKSMSCFGMLAPIDQSLNPIFPKELIIAIGAPDDKARDALRPVCRYLDQKLSINSPYLQELITHPLFRTNTKTLQYLAFNAAWNANENLLKGLMRNMVQPDYMYQYELAERWKSNFGLMRMVKTKMPHKYNEINETAKIYGCELDFYLCSGTCDELRMACYNKDALLLKELIDKDSMS